MSEGLITREIRFLMCVILNASFSRSRMKRVLPMSDPDKLFLLFFAYNKIVSLINFWISLISSNPSATMNLATLVFAPIATKMFAALAWQVMSCLTSEFSWGSEWY